MYYIQYVALIVLIGIFSTIGSAHAERQGYASDQLQHSPSSANQKVIEGHIRL